MDSINKIYDNSIEISFRWKDIKTNLTQIIFRDTGFHLSEEEIEVFVDKIADAKVQKHCKGCDNSKECRSVLLQTPSSKVSMAVSYEELSKIEDLMRGTLFQIRMNNYLNDLCKN